MPERNVHDLLLRHSVYLTGLKRNAGIQFARVALELDADINRLFARVAVKNLGEMTKREFDAFVARLRKDMITTYDRHLTRFVIASKKFASVDIAIHRKLFETAIGRRRGRAPTIGQVWGKTTANVNAATGMKYINAARSAKASSLGLIERAVRTGYAQKIATVDVLRNIVGNKSKSFEGGALRRVAAWGNTFATSTWSHVNSYANHETAKEYYEQYQWISVMDEGTTEICEDLNEQTFPYGDGPVPPAHYGCRSDIIPFTDDAPPTSFVDWLDQQPSEFLNDAFKKGNRELDNVKIITLDQFGEKLEFILI